MFWAKTPSLLSFFVALLFGSFFISCEKKSGDTCNITNGKNCFVEFNQIVDGAMYCFCVTRLKRDEEYFYDSVFYQKQTELDIRGGFAISSEINADETTQNWHFQDINFDGKVDFCFYSLKGAANMTGQYWIYNSNGSFSYLGKFPVLVPANEKKTIRSYVRGGYAGLEYESKEYYFEGDSLVICRTLTQKFDRYEADTSYFILTETARPPCGEISRTVHVKVYPFSADSTVIDTVR